MSRRLKLSFALSGVAAWAIAFLVMGAATAAPSSGTDSAMPATAASLPWKEIIRYGGLLMYVLTAVSMLTVGLIVYFCIILRVKEFVPRTLHRELVEKLRAGALDDARRACEYHPCPLSAVTLAALEYIRKIPTPDPEMLRDIVSGEGGRQADAVQGQTQYLYDIAVLSPMLGLLGSVFGMMKAFSAVAVDIAKAKPIVLAGGVSQALVTTLYGLLVGIPAMAAYSIFRQRAARMIHQLEAATTDVLTAILSRGTR